AMLRNYFKIAFRNLERHKSYAVINIFCLSLGITCAILIFTLVTYHLSFDTFHSHKDRVFRITTELHQDGIHRESNVPQPIGKEFTSDCASAEQVAMVYSGSDGLVSVPSAGSDKRFEKKVAFAEPEFFDILNFPLIEGNKKTVLSEPNTAIITKRI